ncbi:unnamed protein product [Rhizoctonia solani]|uniref:Uncharacterized protein n=1 Tax=Rhizoctonia solani TaxID=456999 RepID=A0A8H3HK86_9AGAM|nr:unnamed protein product [Rhizoctonia solani]
MKIAIALTWACSQSRLRLYVVILRSDGGIQQGLIGRISRTAILEYHAFDDFTRAPVNNMPTHIYPREGKFAAAGHASSLYCRGIKIYTGTGIGAALSPC